MREMQFIELIIEEKKDGILTIVLTKTYGSASSFELYKKIGGESICSNHIKSYDELQKISSLKKQVFL